MNEPSQTKNVAGRKFKQKIADTKFESFDRKKPDGSPFIHQP